MPWGFQLFESLQASLGGWVKPDHGEIGVHIMLLVHCPVCGAEGDETDFHGGGQAHIRRPATHDPANVSDEAQRDYLFIRHNPKGLHFERWRCDRGCGKWFHAARDTVTMEFKAFYGITELPPRDVMEQATGEWATYFKDKLKADAKS
jgi:sarcosine oxidase subunit delta